MKKIYMMLLAVASVMGVQAMPAANFDAKIVMSGSTFISLKDTCDTLKEYVTRRYVVTATKDGAEEICVLDTIKESSSKGGKVTSYSVKDSTICKLYSVGKDTIYLNVVAEKQTMKDGAFEPLAAGANKYALPVVFSVAGYTMMSDGEKDTVVNYSVFDKKSSMYGRYYQDSARLSVKACAIKETKAQWQKREVVDVKDETTPWVNFGTQLTIAAADMQAGKIQSLDVPMNGDGGFRNQYWRLEMKVGDTTLYSSICDVFPDFPFVLVGPIATGDYYNKVSVDEGKKDTLWMNYGQSVTITGNEAKPCFNVPVANPACKMDTVSPYNSLIRVYQPGKLVSVSTKERTTVKLTFFHADTATVMETKDCACGGTYVPQEPTMSDYVFDKWRLVTAAMAEYYTTAELAKAKFYVDKGFFASFVEPSGLKEVMNAMPAGAKMYNVLGQEVKEGYKGIVVVGGKKYMVR